MCFTSWLQKEQFPIFGLIFAMRSHDTSRESITLDRTSTNLIAKTFYHFSLQSLVVVYRICKDLITNIHNVF